MRPSTLQIHTGQPSDAPALTALHVEVWREAYAEIAPPEAYEKLDEAWRRPYWQSVLSDDNPLVGALVVRNNERPEAVLSFGPTDHPAFDGAVEIKHFYVRRTIRGTGFGKKLLNAAFEHLKRQNRYHVALAVVEENKAARNFYAAMGGKEVGHFEDPGPLWRSSNIVVEWQLDDAR